MVLRECFQSACRAAISGGVQEGMNGVSSWTGSDAIASFIVLIIYIIIILMIGKFLWNVVACNLISFAKKADSIWQILGLAILLNLLYG